MRNWFGNRRADGMQGAPDRAASGLVEAEDLALRGGVADDRRKVLVLLLGVAPRDLDGKVDLALRSLDPARDIAIFVVTTLDFGALRRRGLVFEYLPAASDHDAVDAEAFSTYLDRRMALIRLKWVPASEVDLGIPFDRHRAGQIAAVSG
jgi:hypothetical protein